MQLVMTVMKVNGRRPNKIGAGHSWLEGGDRLGLDDWGLIVCKTGRMMIVDSFSVGLS